VTIIRNSARCLRCKDEIESKSGHDFQMCSCGAIFVDGGKMYLRHGGDQALFLNTSITDGNDSE
jgi:hypothetical protein